MTKPWWRMRN